MQVGQRKIYRQGIYSIVALGLALCLFFACQRPPELPITPEIAYLKITKQIGYDILGEKIDSVIISISFKDGDGDLGSKVDTTQNYFCDVLQKDSLGFFKMGDKNGRFLPLNTDAQTGPLEGTLNYAPEILDILTGDTLDPKAIYTLKFRIYIRDNSGHKSNTVETDTIQVQNYQFH